MFNLAALTAPLKSDVELLRQVASGDTSAFDELYVLYGAVVYNYLLRLVNESPIAEELLQEVFLAVWQGADRFRAEARVKNVVAAHRPSQGCVVAEAASPGQFAG